ncbi:hypothetical protein Dimus_025818 [Dionaea muscipula]
MAENDHLAAAAAAESKYKGVRKRKWGKWVSEIRLPHSRERIWLGSYDSAEKAARAFDAAQFCLRGRSGKFNFPDNPPDIADVQGMSRSEIQLAASRYANMVGPSTVDQMELDMPVIHTSSSEEEEMSPSDSVLSLSDGVAPLSHAHPFDQMNNVAYDGDGDVSSASSWYQYNLARLTTMDSGNYALDFGLISGYADYDGSPQTPNHDYADEICGVGGSSCYQDQGSSFLWNF